MNWAAICGRTMRPILALAAALSGGMTMRYADAADMVPTAGVLAMQAERVQSIRDVKDLQVAFSQLAEYGLWSEMARLFAADAVWEEGGSPTLHGRTAITHHLLMDIGGGQLGLPVGALHAELFMSPVVTLSADGHTAQARWQSLSMLGRFGGDARWQGGMEDDDYVRQDGHWKFARVHRYPQFDGPYATGFFARTRELPFIAYRYTPAQAGMPVPPLPADAKIPQAALAPVARRIASMNDEDSIRNLQNIYGYYVDRKMWDDVTDLFAPDGVLEIAGVGIYNGPHGVRRALERDGPQGLETGQVNDHIQISMIVTVDPDGVEAQARGLELGMLTPHLGVAYWSIATFLNRYIKQDGIWRIREMRIFPRMKADYDKGWAASSVVDPPPSDASAPDLPSPSERSPQHSRAIPVFSFPNPGDGTQIHLPPGTMPVGGDRLRPPPMPRASAVSASLADAAHGLAIAQARDAVENISSAFGFYLDDFQWQPYVELFSPGGRREKTCCGFYIGRDHIFRAEALSYGPMPIPRDGIRLHTRLQPVIDVAADGKSAYLRTRMLLYYANSTKAGAWNSGMYPNESAVLDHGVWKMNVGGGIDETYFMSPSYRQGWAHPTLGADPMAAAAAAGPTAPRGPRVDFPPDIPISALGRRGEGFARGLPNYISWPQIKPMWFHYRNPVSGRVPANYCPDITTCIPPLAAATTHAPALPR